RKHGATRHRPQGLAVLGNHTKLVHGGHVLVQVGDRCVGGDLRCGGVGRRTCVEGRGRGQYACAVHVLDETLDVVVGGLVEDLLGGADLCDPPVPEHADPIAQAHGLVEVVDRKSNV